MITKEQILSGASKQTLKTLASGPAGSGKTQLVFTFPRIAYLCTEPNGLDTARSNPALLNNLVWADEFLPKETVLDEKGNPTLVEKDGEIISEPIMKTFLRLDKAIEQAHKDYAEGKIDTLALDNLTFLLENRWIYITRHELLKTNTGAVDTRGMYGILGRWAYTFIITKILSFKGNVICTTHEQSESEEAMAKKTDKTMGISPALLGGIRNEIGGMFSAHIFLEKKRLAENKYEYWARCQKGNQREAKNRYNLPEMVANVSYASILASVGKGGAK